jgi:glycosyl transferase family 2
MFHPSSHPKRQFVLNSQTPPVNQIPATSLPPAPEPHTLLTPAIRVVSTRQVHPGMRFGKLLMLLLILLTLDSIFLGGNPIQAQHWYLFIIWAAYAPLTIVGLLGAWASRKEIIRPYIGSRPERVIFLIPTVARKDTLPGLRRVVDSILYCAIDCLPNSEVHIVIDEGAECADAIMQQYAGQSRVRCLCVPRGYRPPNGTKYKARANEFALQFRRAVGLNGPNVFVYHGDEDTSIAHDTIWSICSFIARGKHDLAQGLLTYPHQLSPGWFCRLADSIRPADDMSRFYFYTARIGTPLVGCHGEHLLIRASIEDQIGWDFGEMITAEGAYFGLTFATRYPGRATFLASCCYGASPENVGSLVRQRKRRARGLLGLLADRQIPMKAKVMLYYGIANRVIGIFQHILFVLLLMALIREPGVNPVAPWVIALWCANFAYQVWMYLEGLRINLEASQAPRWQFVVWPVIQIVLIPVLLLVEAWAAFLGLCAFLARQQGFDVSSKGH